VDEGQEEKGTKWIELGERREKKNERGSVMHEERTIWRTRKTERR
jgi:hypothetical protein